MNLSRSHGVYLSGGLSCGVLKQVQHDILFYLFNMETSNNAEHDWFDDLTEDQQQSVLSGLEQADKGEGIPHEEAIIRLGL